eukprot:NODE_7141_length_463_cov_7.255952_g6975_i0.p2 GENE.NODE_7141_length_463_cov_7.255952_g6975_i0~~NODE_7141_length_463_cov_7.255952_g6975_i0.p2  ORF type:complete len:140 (-),score=29.09 NODE_7141_length_463_cov_7.255952_g6975_i0:42-431(-)
MPATTNTQIPKRKTKPTRLFQPAVMVGYKRNKRNQRPTTSLLDIKNVASGKEARFYVGKRCLYLFKATKVKKGPKTRRCPKLKTNIRRIWGRVVGTHGNSGVVKAKFKPNLPGQAISQKVRVYLYPSFI